MADSTKIEWADATFNPWLGCANVSAGCGHCYAKTWSENRMGIDVWFDKPRQVTAPANWRKPLKWAREMPDELGRRPRVFCASMADVFEDLPQLVEPRKRLFDLIEQTIELDWLILTKRPEVAHSFYFERGWTLTANVWLGTSIENSRFTWRADVLREIPAAVRFISAEPLLGSLYDGRSDARAPDDESHLDQRRQVPQVSAAGVAVGLRPRLRQGDSESLATHARARAPLDLSEIDWVIIGGESGPKARRSDPTWMREVLEACRREDVAPFVKQLGAVLAREWGCVDRKGGDITEWKPGLSVREFPRSAVPA